MIIINDTVDNIITEILFSKLITLIVFTCHIIHSNLIITRTRDINYNNGGLFFKVNLTLQNILQ